MLSFLSDVSECIDDLHAGGFERRRDCRHDGSRDDQEEHADEHAGDKVHEQRIPGRSPRRRRHPESRVVDQLRESGTHQELLAARGIYWKLYLLQYRDQEARAS